MSFGGSSLLALSLSLSLSLSSSFNFCFFFFFFAFFTTTKNLSLYAQIRSCIVFVSFYSEFEGEGRGDQRAWQEWQAHQSSGMSFLTLSLSPPLLSSRDFFFGVPVGFLGFQNALFWCFCSFFFNLLVLVSFTLLYLQFIWISLL